MITLGHYGMRKKRISLVFIFLTSLLQAEEKLSTWSLVTGSTLKGTGQSWDQKGMKIKRSLDGKVIEIPFEKLNPKDVIRAVNETPFRPNDRALLYALTVSTEVTELTKVTHLLRNTGRYLAHVNLFSYNRYNLRGSATITPVTEKYRISGRLVEVELRSIYGDGFAAIEFFAIEGKGDNREICDAQSGVFKFRDIGSKRYFSTRAVEDFQGWVVVLRSPNTGEIIKTGSSRQSLETFVISKIPKIAKFKTNAKPLREQVIKEAKKRPRVSKNFGEINLSITKATFGVGREKTDVTDKIRAYAKDPTKTVKISSSGMGVNNPKGYNRLCLSIAYLVNGRSYLVNIPRGDSRNIFELLRDPETPAKYPAAGFELVKASFGGGKNYADVTERVRVLLSSRDESFRVNPSNLKKDPTPGWKKKLRITLKLNGATITKEWAEDRNVYFSKYSL